MMKSALLRSLFLPALTFTLGSSTLTSQAVVLFDGISDVTAFNLGGVPNTFMGEAVALDASAFSATLNSVSSFDVGVGNVTGANITALPVRLNMWIYLTYSPSATTAPAFADQVGVPGSPTFVFDFSAFTLNTGFLTIATLTLGTPLVLTPTSGSTIGVALNWQVDRGAGFVSEANFTTIVHANVPPTVGENATGVPPTFGYYRNASGETNGNFLGTSARIIGGTPTPTDSGLMLRINGPDIIPEPTVTVLGAVFGLTLLRRRRS